MIGKRVLILVTLTMSMVLLQISPSAAVTQHHPKGIFAPFADCPLTNPAVTRCALVRITGGEFVLGKRTVPINKTILLQGGLIYAGGANLNEYVLAGAEDGNTLSRGALGVPGGLLGIGNAASASEATATAELATPPYGVKLDLASLAERKGVALSLPLRIRLENRLLGNSCYIGSSSSPVVLALTNGTTSPPLPNRPITGNFGAAKTIVEDELEVTRLSYARLVDNAFAAPAVTACSPSYAALVDSNIGLPAPAGRNTAILSATMELAEAEAVKESE